MWRMAALVASIPRRSMSPTHGTDSAIDSIRSWRRMYTGLDRIFMRLSDSLEIVGAYERPLSLRMIVTLLSEWPRLFSPSMAMPPVSEPSPTTTTTRRSSPRVLKAVARPWA